MRNALHQMPVVDRFAAQLSEPVGWPWTVEDGTAQRGPFDVVDLARDVVIRRGMAQERAIEQAKWAHRYAPPILGFNKTDRPIGLAGGYVFEVWGWQQRPRFTTGSDSAWTLEALCDSRQSAACIGSALLEYAIAHHTGPTAVEVWAPTSKRWPGTWECLDRDELGPGGGLIRHVYAHVEPGHPGPAMPWHEQPPNGTNVAADLDRLNAGTGFRTPGARG